MKKFIVWVVMIGSILLVWCSKAPSSETTNPEETVTENQNVFKWTAKDLFKKGDNVSCSFTFENEDTKEEWTVYVDKGMMKTVAKVLLKKENMSMEAFSVTKDGYTYTRSNIQKSQWAKFRNIDDKGNEEIYTEDPLDDKEVNFICKETKIDESTFAIPADISFMDITEYLKDK